MSSNVSQSAFQICDRLHYHLHFTFHGYIMNSRRDQLPVALMAQSLANRALHQYRRDHGFESHSGLNCFETLISQLLKLWV